MRPLILALILSLPLPLPLAAQAPDLTAVVEDHIIDGYRALETTSAQLSESAKSECSADSSALRQAYHAAFDAWVGVSHLRFGPSEQNNHAFALAYWPDTHSAMPKALGALLRNQDPVVETPQSFETVSIAARGFYAMEYLLFDQQFSGTDAPDYHCALVQAVAQDVADNAQAIRAEWQDGYGELMISANNDTYRSSAEAAQQIFTALTTGIEFTADTRLGRPLGSFERPRPTRAEAYRSERSLRHVVLSLEATRELAAMLSQDDPDIDATYAAALATAETLDDPAFAGVSTPQGRVRVEALQQKISGIRGILASNLGPRLGVAAGFNSLDGD